MPTFTTRQITEVPRPTRSPKAVRETQELYESFIRSINGNVGELQLSTHESVRSVKVRLRRAASRMGTYLDIWDHNGHVYFKAAAKRGRPRKTT